MAQVALRSIIAAILVWLAGIMLARSFPGVVQGFRSAGLPAAHTTMPAAKPSPGRLLVVTADLRGQYIISPIVDGLRLTMLLDTGASFVSLSSEDAAAIGLRPGPSDFTRRMSTANGIIGAASVRIRDMRIGDITVRDVEAVVMPPGKLERSLLGMSFLRRLPGFDISRGQLTLRG